MALVIENKDMPKCCDDCFALDDYGDYPMCRITGEQRGYTFDTSSKRMDECPLREVLTITINALDSDDNRCTYYEENGKEPCCTHSCDGCIWYC